MTTSYLPYDPGQRFLLPPVLQDWLPKGRLANVTGECGLVKLGTIVVDGTKLRAKASKHKSMSYERMQIAEAELKAQIQALLERATQTDVSEADEPELDIPSEIARREQRVAAIQAARQRPEERQRLADMQSGRKPGIDDSDDSDDSDGPPTPPAQHVQSVQAPSKAAVEPQQKTNGESGKPGTRLKRAFGIPLPKA